MTEAVTKRLSNELMQLMMSKEEGCSAFPDGENLYSWVGTIHGASETVYEDFKFKLSIKFTEDYPFSAPKIKFISPCFHPNVDNHGNICLDILKENWSASYSVSTILVSLRSLLNDPNNDSPLNTQAANLWSNQGEYKRILFEKCKECRFKK